MTEQDILARYSTPGLRKTCLDNPHQPEVPWHEYPVPIYYIMIEGEVWRHWTMEEKPLAKYIVSMKYSDGSIWDRKGGWRDELPIEPVLSSPPDKPLPLSPSQLMKLDPQGVLPS